MSGTPAPGTAAMRALPVVVATAGREQSDSAIALARVLAAQAEMLRVVVAVAPRDRDSRDEAIVGRVLSQMDRVGAADVDLEFREGEPAETVTRVARESDACMIVCGLGSPSDAGRPRPEIALRLAGCSSVPVLAVAPGLTHAPRRLVVSLDFSETSVRAARLALNIAAPGAVVHLVHAADPMESLEAEEALADLRDQLRVPPGVTVRKALLHGDPVAELLTFASGINADLVAGGSTGLGFVSRTIVGRVATSLVRYSRRSVLLVPPRESATG